MSTCRKFYPAILSGVPCDSSDVPNPILKASSHLQHFNQKATKITHGTIQNRKMLLLRFVIFQPVMLVLGYSVTSKKTRKITLKLQIDPFWENDIIQVTPYDSWPWCVFFCEKFGATGHESKEQDSKGRRANFLVSILMRKVSVISLIQCQCFQHIISHHIYNAMQLQYVSLSYQSCIINIIFETPTCCSFLFAFFRPGSFVGKSLWQATLK